MVESSVDFKVPAESSNCDRTSIPGMSGEVGLGSPAKPQDVTQSAHHRELQIRSAPGFCGGVDGAADAGSEVQEVVPRRAESEHGSDENALQHARMVIARLSAALKLSEAELVRLRDRMTTVSCACCCASAQRMRQRMQDKRSSDLFHLSTG